MPYKRPFRRSYKRKRPMMRRRTTSRRAPSRVARKALRIATTLNKTRELKFKDNTLAGAYPGRQITDMYFEPFSNVNIPRNDTDNGRVGDNLYAKSLIIQGSITLPDQLGTVLTSVTNRQNFIRLWVAMWPSPAITITDVQNLFTNNNSQWVAPFSQKSWQYRFRSRLLYSKVYKINTFSPQVHFYVKLRLNKLVQYDASGNILYNQILYGFISDNTTGIVGGTYAKVEHVQRATWTDS